MKRPKPTNQLELGLPRASLPSAQPGLVHRLRAKLSSRDATVLLFWGVLNAFAAIGIVAVLFVMLANGTFTSVMVEAGNLAAHYSSAPPASQARFREIVWVALAIAFLALSIARWRSLRIAQQSLSDAHGDNPARS